jgi:hypothetical protein
MDKGKTEYVIVAEKASAPTTIHRYYLECSRYILNNNDILLGQREY